MHVHTHINMHAYIDTHAHTYAYIHTYRHRDIYTDIHIHTHCPLSPFSTAFSYKVMPLSLGSSMGILMMGPEVLLSSQR